MDLKNLYSNGNLIICVGVFFLICFVLLIVSLCIAVGNRKRLNRIMRKSRNGNLAEDIEKYYNKLNETADEIREAVDVIDKIEKDCANAFGQYAVVSFDAFDDLRGNYSFCVAVLNQHNDGFILTSLYGHDCCNTYVKTIKNGESSVQLMNEEKEAVSKALYK